MQYEEEQAELKGQAKCEKEWYDYDVAEENKRRKQYDILKEEFGDEK
jgi:hypothetical protein